MDGAIHCAGGPTILQDCVARFPHGLATGEAGWTTAGDLPARWVIHTVGPNHAAGQHDRTQLTSCYRRSLEVADELGARSVAFPLISAGIYAWPRHDAIAAAIETIRGAKTDVEDVWLVAFHAPLVNLSQCPWVEPSEHRMRMRDVSALDSVLSDTRHAMFWAEHEDELGKHGDES